jgi:hypothetical protein
MDTIEWWVSCTRADIYVVASGTGLIHSKKANNA